MANVDALRRILFPLSVISVVSTVLVMAVTGRVSQALLKKAPEKREPIKEKASGTEEEEQA